MIESTYIPSDFNGIFCLRENKLEVVLNFIDFDRHYRVLDTIELNDRIIILFDSFEMSKSSQAQNLKCFKLDGTLVWIAEHPTNQTADTYININYDGKLKANSFGGYLVDLDLETGKILDSIFTK